jgi:hypothetical protein
VSGAGRVGALGAAGSGLGDRPHLALSSWRAMASGQPAGHAGHARGHLLVEHLDAELAALAVEHAAGHGRGARRSS